MADGAWLAKLRASMRFERRCMDFYLLVLGLVGGLLLGNFVWNVLRQIPEQYYPLLSGKSGIQLICTLSSGGITGVFVWQQLARVRARLEGACREYLEDSATVRDIMTCMTGEWKLDLDNPQREPALERNRIEEPRAEQSIAAWLLQQIPRIERNAPLLERNTRPGWTIYIMWIVWIAGAYLLDRYSIQMDYLFWLSLLILMGMPVWQMESLMRPQLWRYLLPEEVFRRLEA